MGTINTIGNILSASPTSGTAGGPDVSALVNQAMAAATAPIQLLQQQQTTLNNQASALQNLQTDLGALVSAVTVLNSAAGDFNAVSATSSNTSVVTATADTTAAAAAHSIVVNSLATTSSYYTDPVASSSTPLTTGSFDLTVGSNAPVTVTVGSSNNTLDGLAAYINNQNYGVSAAVINDANGARLALVSKSSGGPGDLAVSSNSTGLTFHKAVTGLNASLTVDGVPISTTGNTVTGVLQGVTLNLNGAAPSTTVSLTLAPDNGKAADAVNQFVTAYNKVIGDINQQFTVFADGSGAGPLESDGTLREIQQRLLSAVVYSITGNNGLVNLASIGVNANNDGTLSVDSSKLSSALSSDFSSVKNLMQGAALSGFAANFSTVLNEITDPTQGSLALDLQGVTQTNQDLSSQIADMQAGLVFKRQSLIAQYSQVEAILQELPLLQAQITQQLGSLK